MSVDALIAGAGPGLTTACELARYGLSVRIVDKNIQRTDKSKAIVVWARTLEFSASTAIGSIGVNPQTIAHGSRVGRPLSAPSSLEGNFSRPPHSGVIVEKESDLGSSNTIINLRKH